MLVSVLLILANTSRANPVIGRSPGIFNDVDGGRRVRLHESNSSFEALSMAAMGVCFHCVSLLIENSSFQSYSALLYHSACHRLRFTLSLQPAINRARYFLLLFLLCRFPPRRNEYPR